MKFYPNMHNYDKIIYGLGLGLGGCGIGLGLESHDLGLEMQTSACNKVPK